MTGSTGTTSVTKGPGKNPANGNSFVPDRNAGIWKPVYLKTSGAVVLGSSTVNSELPLPRTDSARLTIYSSLRNASAQQVRGVLRATITRPGKPDLQVEQPVTLAAGEQREVSFTPEKFAQLTVHNPDLWWPYTLGQPNLYDLQLEFRQYNRPIDASHLRFGIRSVQQYRDQDQQFPELGKGGNFYLKVNGKDFLVRGAAYTPDLLYANDPNRDAAILGYVKDLGLNMIRLEGKFPGDHIAEMADEMGIPLMYGWMCCNQWEKWNQWDDEDTRVAQDSLRSQIEGLRSHPSVFVWANGSDGKAPPDVLAKYHAILSDLHWQNATVDTVSSLATDESGERDWDGIQMAGPYSWRPPSYWFAGRYAATRGSTAEQGDNEQIPPFASLKKFIPPDKLWPINDAWFFHAGSNPKNAALTSIRRAVDRRYGVSNSAEEFARKAQLAHYESTRAQFEAFAAGGWDNHKMTIYWMLNNHWPSFFGHIFDYYLRPGGAYYGAKKGLRPLSVVFDSYATGNHDHANITVVNQTPTDQKGLAVRVRVYDLQGRVRDDRSAGDINVTSGGAVQVLALPRLARDSSVLFVRAQLLDTTGKVVSENVYWQSQQLDDVGDPSNDSAFELKQRSWADMTGLNYMTQVPLDVTASRTANPGDDRVTIRLHNPSQRVAFFERAELISTPEGRRDPAGGVQRQLRDRVPGRDGRTSRTGLDRCGRQLGESDGLQHPARRGGRRSVRRRPVVIRLDRRVEFADLEAHRSATDGPAAAVLIALKPIAPRLSVVGSVLAVVLVRRYNQLPVHDAGVSESAGGGFPALSLTGEFLLKDIPLLGLSFWTLADSLRAAAGLGYAKPKKREEATLDDQSTAAKLTVAVAPTSSSLPR